MMTMSPFLVMSKNHFAFARDRLRQPWLTLRWPWSPSDHGAACVKMPLFLGVLMAVGWACFNGYMNAFAVVGGILLVHGTMLIRVISTAAAAQATNRDR